MNGDWLKSYWAIILFVLTVAAGVGTTFQRIGAMEDEQHEAAQERQQIRSSITDIKSAQAVTQSKLEAISEEQQVIKQDIKAILRAVRQNGHEHGE